ncbi:MAG TPA: ABC transporter permease [Thermoanaerobaculia bacterium]|nr:ABC transporter permease [Thermoanaerobaculia bacterium]
MVRVSRVLLSLSGLALLGVAWHLAVAASPGTLIPSPRQVALAIGELAVSGQLLRYAVASLFRVTWGYLAAVIIAVPLGMWLGLSSRADAAIGPLLQLVRPISPLAWIPLAILWFGVGDLSAIFLIFLASLLPLLVTVVHAVQEIDVVHLRAATNFGMSGGRLLRSLIIPAILPQVVVGLRIALGIAWLVVVAAEMLAVNSGLGFLIVDARNAGNRYDLVVAGMALIGMIGVGLDALMRRLERLESVRWGIPEAAA